MAGSADPLYDPDWAPGQAPHEIGRARFGRIAIANSDSGATVYSDVAIDQVNRAVNELFPGQSRSAYAEGNGSADLQIRRDGQA